MMPRLTVEALQSALGGEIRPRKDGTRQVLCPGPGHSPADRSLSVAPADNDDGFIVKSFADNPWQTCKDYVRERLRLPRPKLNGSRHSSSKRREIEATYDYTDEHGALLYQVVRYKSKAFSQRRPDGKGGWNWKLGDVRRVLYRLPDVAEVVALEQPIFITEGEKDANALWSIGVPATCNPQGAGKWRDEFSAVLKHATVHVLPDNDEPGRSHARQVTQSLVAAGAKVRVIELPGLPEHGDVSSWLKAGGTAECLYELADQTRLWRPTSEPPAGDGEAESAAYSDDALASRFTRKHRDDLRHVARWAQWRRWNGHYWAEDNTLQVFNDARFICREAAELARKDPVLGGRVASTATQVSSAKTVAAVERLARADRAHAATVDQWDADLLLLNTPGGAVVLPTGLLRPAKQEDYCTKSTSCAPGGPCPTWEKFLHRITDGNIELVAFLKRVAGYMLSGITVEQVIFFGYGTGANGKTTYAHTLSRILHEYALTAPIETFTVSGTDRHPTEIAMLRGARLVIANETEDGRKWAESRIKQLTGGDTVAARYMRMDYFTFTPQFKLFVIGNHKPALQHVDEAMRRRLHLIPFNVTIPPHERDPALPEKLAEEHGGILAWAVQGFLEWQREGLNPPPVVKNATESYLIDEDHIRSWMAERCEESPAFEATTAQLFANYSDWAEKAGERAGNLKSFVQELEKRGFERAKLDNKTKRGFRGLRLR
jgi:putative DNA primase/helicase